MERENEVFHRRDESWNLGGCELRSICSYTQSKWRCSKKCEKYWTKDDKENVSCSLKAKSVNTSALYLDEFLRVSHCENSKEVWDIL